MVEEASPNLVISSMRKRNTFVFVFSIVENENVLCSMFSIRSVERSLLIFFWIDKILRSNFALIITSLPLTINTRQHRKIVCTCTRYFHRSTISRMNSSLFCSVAAFCIYRTDTSNIHFNSVCVSVLFNCRGAARAVCPFHFLLY